MNEYEEYVMKVTHIYIYVFICFPCIPGTEMCSTCAMCVCLCVFVFVEIFIFLL